MAGQESISFFLATVIIAGAIVVGPTTSLPTSLSPESVPIPSPAASPASAAPPMPPKTVGIKGAYWPSWLAGTLLPWSIPTALFTHVFYAFVELNDSTYRLNVTQSDDQWMPIFTASLHGRNPAAKALLTIGGGNSSSTTFSNMACNPSFRAAFIYSAMAVARKYRFDGLDIDWEFPSNPEDMSNLALLFAEFREALEFESVGSGRPRLLLSAAVYFASNFFLAEVPRAYPSEAIRKYLDFVSPMCFDYHGNWDTSVTGEHALLYDKTSNVSTSYGISSWIAAGVPPEMIVMGLPLYGRSWALKYPDQNWIGAPAVGVGPGTNGVMTYDEILSFNEAYEATVVYDEESASTYSSAGTAWIGYDGLRSTEVKVDFARANRLGGYFFWALGYDTNWTLPRAGKGNIHFLMHLILGMTISFQSDDSVMCNLQTNFAPLGCSV